MHLLFVFAHQDDEVAMATRILDALRRGDLVTCVYLTNGATRRAPAHVRDQESREVLQRLGVDLERVHFIGSQHGIADGRLHQHLHDALQLLEARVPEPVDEIVTLAWEGGHHDHDATHAVAVRFAHGRGMAGKVYEMPMYHGHRLPGPLFRTLTPLRVGGEWTARPIRFRDGLRIALLCRFYRSQRKTWLGLLPEALLRLALGRKEWSRRVDAAVVHARPHEGPLFYERRFRVSYDEVAERIAEFLQQSQSGRR
ncbi:MAG TPA: PIG-L family deacetylase [Thermoanaerobaculia bacterium]